MSKGGGGMAMPAQPSYQQGLTEALKAQVGLLKGTGEFAEIAPEGLAGLVPLEAEVRQLSTQADTDAIQTALLGGFTTADADGRVIKAYSEEAMEGGAGWDNWAPTVQRDMGDALDQIFEMGGHVTEAGAVWEHGQFNTTSPGGRLLEQMGYEFPELAGTESADQIRNGRQAVLDQFFSDAGWERGTWGSTGERGAMGALRQGVIGGGHDNQSGYERAVGSGATAPREPIYDEQTYEPGQKVRDPQNPGLVDLLGSSEAITEGRNPAEQRRYDELRQSGQVRIRNGREVADFTPEEQTEWDTLKGVGDPTTRKPGFDENDQFMGLSKLGEDLRIQGASAGRAADIADIEANLAQFQAIMDKVRPETTQMLDDAVKVVQEQGKRLMGTPPSFEEWAAGREPGEAADRQIYDDLIASGELKGGFSISEPKSMEKLATTIARLPPDEAGKLSPQVREMAEQMSPTPRAAGTELAIGERAPGAQMQVGERTMAEQIAGVQRGEADQMAGFAGLGMGGLRGTLQTQAQADLDAGRGLSPRQRIEAEQSARRGWEARGLIRDPEAVVSEVESVMEARGAEEARRRAFAGGVLGQEAGLRTGELGRGMAQEEFNIQQEIARQEANIQRTMGAQESNVQREVARQEANLGRSLTTQEFNVIQDAARQEANIGRQMAGGEFNIQQEVARQEANLGRQLTADEFNIVQETGRQQEIGIQDLAAQEYNIGQEVARQETNIGRQISGGMTDVGATMDQERLNEVLRQQGILGYMGATTQLAALEDIQQQKLDPFQAILGRPSSSGVPGFGMGQQIGGSAGYGLTAAPQFVAPEAGLGYIQAQAANQASMYNAQQAAAATRSAGMFGGLGAIGGGIATGLIMCWVAREVYGVDNPRWLEFREWMLNKAPTALREWYIRNGERVALAIRGNDSAKNEIRSMMDGILEAT